MGDNKQDNVIIDRAILKREIGCNDGATPVIAIFGSVDFYNDTSQGLCQSIGKQLAERFSHVILVTGANAVQETVSQDFFDSIMASKKNSPKSHR